MNSLSYEGPNNEKTKRSADERNQTPQKEMNKIQMLWSFPIFGHGSYNMLIRPQLALKFIRMRMKKRDNRGFHSRKIGVS